jgi:4-amino-4-deoxychorismate lyase
MNYLFFESIRLFNGRFENLSLHEERMARALKFFDGRTSKPDLKHHLSGFDIPQKGLYKCRLSYAPGLAPPEFVPYNRKRISSLRLVESSGCSYPHKFTDRSCIEQLMEQRLDCDDILITRNGFLSDTSYCNIFLKNRQGVWITPSTPLLPGIQRQSILMHDIAEAKTIHVDELRSYISFKLVNAMIPWEDSEEIPAGNIIGHRIG